jgi:hypothetical protein
MALIDDSELSSGSELEAVEQQETTKAPVQQAPEVPSKYKGKSLEEIVQMHQEAERLIGRQAQEVGEVRRLADELLKQQLASKQEQTQQVDNELDFFEDPKTAVQQAVAKHPDVLAAKQAAMQMKQLQTQAMLAKRHPDFAQVVQDPEFAAWIKASPMRMNLYSLADAQYDFQAADELIGTFKQIKGARQTQVVTEATQARAKDLKAANVDVSGTGESSKKVYRRADLIRLKMTDPDRYEALQPEIMSAYADGRVK